MTGAGVKRLLRFTLLSLMAALALLLAVLLLAQIWQLLSTLGLLTRNALFVSAQLLPALLLKALLIALNLALLCAASHAAKQLARR